MADHSVLAEFPDGVQSVRSVEIEHSYFVVEYPDGRRDFWEQGSPAKRLVDWPGWSGHFFVPENRLVVWYNDGRAYLLDLKWLSAMGEFPEAIDLESLEKFQGLTCGQEDPDKKGSFANPNAFYITRLKKDLKPFGLGQELPCPPKESRKDSQPDLP
jgi:hypothetical protein